MAEKKNTVAVCTELAKPIAEKMGLYIWDVRFEKEGSTWFLRYFLDKDTDGGININECEQFSRTIDPLLDKLDPIEQSYCLEVSSPGIERELTKPEHFAKYIGHLVTVRYIRPIDGIKEFDGTLEKFSDGVATVSGKQVLKQQVANIKLKELDL